MNTTVLNILVVLLVFGLSMFRNNKKIQDYLATKLERLLFGGNKTNKLLQGELSQVPVSYNGKINELNPYFTNNKDYTLKSIYDGMCAFREYEQKSLQHNSVLRNRFLSLPKGHLQQLKAIKYDAKLDAIDNTIVEVNQNSISKMLTSFVGKSPELTDFFQEKGLKIDLLESLTTNGTSNYRVMEALNHLVRDYSKEMFQLETKPLLSYILDRLSKVKFSSKSVQAKDVIIVPGSGVGRIAHEIAVKYPHCEVHSIEFSNLMYLSNQFVYNSDENCKVSPFVNYYSNHVTNQNQLRSFEIPMSKFSRPDNLHSHFGDFNKFSLPKNENYAKIAVVSAFFVDTAENMLTYVDTIESFQRVLSTQRSLHWINVGPLKYGTKPIIQLSMQDLSQLRLIRGWKDLHENCNTESKIGYITDKDGLYKSYYSVVEFHTTK